MGVLERDGRLGEMAESDDRLRVLAESDDGRAATYAYRGFRFTVERSWLTWWCHQGLSRPGDMLAICHEIGRASCRERVSCCV